MAVLGSLCVVVLADPAETRNFEPVCKV